MRAAVGSQSVSRRVALPKSTFVGTAARISKGMIRVKNSIADLLKISGG